MKIDLEKVPDDFTMDYELCIFCNQPTPYFTADPVVNRPVCVLCSTTHTESDIEKAKYNY